MSQTQTNLVNKEDLDILVQSMTGVSLDSLNSPEGQEIIEQCVETFVNYILDYVKINSSEKDSLRLKAILLTGDEKVFDKFEDLEGIYLKAYDSFFEEVSKEVKA